MQSEIESLNRLKDPKSKVSCHYLINKSGLIIQLVADNKIAWHAGKSKWKNFSNLNSISIGIELQNTGHQHSFEKYPNKQITSLITLCKFLKKRYAINRNNFLGHSDIAPLRKLDPGEKFPWNKLNQSGFGIHYKIKKDRYKIDKNKLKQFFFKNLHKIGYRYFKIKKRVSDDKLIVKAFQRRFRSEKVSGIIDKKTFEISHFLANYS